MQGLSLLTLLLALTSQRAMNGQVTPLSLLFSFYIAILKIKHITFFYWQIGSRSFNRKSLHHIGDGLNPYEQAITIIGKTLAAFDEDNLIPCYGFGDGIIFKLVTECYSL